MTFTTTRTALAGALSVALLFLLSACGGGSSDLATVGGGTGPGTAPQQPDTGEVSIVLKDAPLSSLQTFTIDVTKATLLGGNTTADATVYPTGTSTGSLSVDLLSLQALNQVLSAATIPVGDYGALKLEFTNPQATDVNNVAQNIQGNATEVTAIFAPSLSISANSSQTVQVDIDLRASVIDMGGNNILFAPVALVQVTNQAVALQQFPIDVVSIDTANQSFTGDIGIFLPLGGVTTTSGSGRLTVNTDQNTTYSDGQGNVSTGNVTAQLTVGDGVLVDGSMLNGVVTATRVTAMPSFNTPPTGPRSNIVFLDSTIMSTDSANNQLTVKVRHTAMTGAGTAPARFTDVTINTTSNTIIDRSGFLRNLDDLVPGNAAFIVAEEVNSALEASDIAEEPAFVKGPATAVSAGSQGNDSVIFTPEEVDQIKASQLPFLPSSLTVEIPSSLGTTVGDTVRVVGYFDGNGGFDALGGPVNTLPPIQQSFTVFGPLTSTTTPAINNGELTFDLDHMSAIGSSSSLAVTVTATATVDRIDANGNVTTITLQDALSALTSNPSDWDIAALGTNAPVNNSFTADQNLSLFNSGFSRGVPGTGNNPPGGGNGGGGSMMPPSVGGIVNNTAIVNGNSEVEFELDMGFDILNAGSAVIDVVVPANAIMTEQSLRRSTGGTSSTKTITQAELVAALNANPSFVYVTGSWDAANKIWTATEIALGAQEFPVTGQVNGTAVETTSGELSFSLDAFNSTTGALATVSVTAPASTELRLLKGNGNVVILTTVAEAVTALNNNPVSVAAWGTSAVTSSNTFVADLEVTIAEGFSGPNGGGNTGGGPGGGGTTFPDTLTGTVSGTASLSGNGEITFTLDIQPPSNIATGSVTVTVTAAAALVLLDRTFTPPQTLTAQEAVNALNASPQGVAVTGTLSGTSFQCDKELAIFK